MEGQAVEVEVEVVDEVVVEMAVEAVVEMAAEAVVETVEEVTCKPIALHGETEAIAGVVMSASLTMRLKTRALVKAAVLAHLYHSHEMEAI